MKPVVLLALTALCVAPINSKAETLDARGIQFIAIKSFSKFTKSPGERPDETVLTSPEITARIEWDELIASWNAETPANEWLKIEVRAVYPERATKWFTMGLWSGDPAKHPRESVRHQKDPDGNVDTDTLSLQQPARKFQVRLTLGGDARQKPKLKFVSLSLLDSRAKPEPLAPNRAAWGKTIDVLERSQMAYENGNVLCSPTTVSMLLAHWSKQLKHPGLDHDVPEVVKGVFDPQWGGTGNWVFNTAYAGSLRGMRAYTARLSDVAELEDFVARGIPVGLSLCYNRLRGRSRVPSGHLVVCVGFTENGDAVINDPGTSKNVRKVFPRANLIDAWAYSKNAAYLIYPETARLPVDRFGHWDSAASRKANSVK
ncbi:MAG: peptidase C39 family protein [Pedosphaera sp.]|nr:peptidase C39 family protein [Pedosphaera sp.]